MNTYQEWAETEERVMDHEREELEAEHGAFRSEHAAGFDLSRRELSAVDNGRIAELVRAGRFVVVQAFERRCRFTDALLPCAHVAMSDHASREEADAALERYEDEDQRVWVEPCRWEAEEAE